MPQTTTPMPTRSRRSQLAHVRTARRSATTAAGIAAERRVIAARERGTGRARDAAHRLTEIPVETVQSDL